MNDQADVISLDLNDVLPEAPEQSAARKSKHLERQMTNILVRTYRFLTEPNDDNLCWLLFALASYMSAKGVKVTSDKEVLLTWHTATCGECDIDTDGSMNSGCDTYDEYVHRLRWQRPNFPVDEIKD